MKAEIDLLNYLYKDAFMGRESLNDLIKSIMNKNNTITSEAEEISEGYFEFLKKIESELLKLDSNIQEPNLLSKASAYLGIKKEVNKDNSDANIADMIIKGLTKGEISIAKSIKTYKGQVSEHIIDIATELKEFHSAKIKAIKKEYL